MTSSIPRESLNEILRVEAAGGGAFTTDPEDFWGDPMGADVFARAALAAAQGAGGRQLVSLQGYLDPGLRLAPLHIEIESADAGDGILRCAVALSQEAPTGRYLATFAPASPEQKEPDYQDFAPSETPPDPESLPSTLEQARNEGWPEAYARGPVEFRRVGSIWRDAAANDSYHHLVWLKPRAPLADDAALHCAALAFASGFYPHWEFERRIGPKFAHPVFRSLDQSLHVHRPLPFDDWWLLEARNEVAHAGLALSTRRLYTRGGSLIASASSHARVAVS